MTRVPNNDQPRRKRRETSRHEKWRTAAAMLRSAAYIWMLVRELW